MVGALDSFVVTRGSTNNGIAGTDLRRVRKGRIDPVRENDSSAQWLLRLLWREERDKGLGVVCVVHLRFSGLGRGGKGDVACLDIVRMTCPVHRWLCVVVSLMLPFQSPLLPNQKRANGDWHPAVAEHGEAGKVHMAVKSCKRESFLFPSLGLAGISAKPTVSPIHSTPALLASEWPANRYTWA